MSFRILDMDSFDSFRRCANAGDGRDHGNLGSYAIVDGRPLCYGCASPIIYPRRNVDVRPFAVRAWSDWDDGAPLVRRFSDRANALDFAASLDRDAYPLVDVSHRGRGIFASRRLVAHPADRAFSPRDTIGGPR